MMSDKRVTLSSGQIAKIRETQKARWAKMRDESIAKNDPAITETAVAVRDVQGPTDEQAGAVLTEKYEQALRSMFAIVEFGGLMLRKRDEIQRGLLESGGSGNEKGSGLKAWMKRYAPKVKMPTASRFMACAEATIQLAKLRRGADIAELLGAAIDSLTAAQKKQRAKIEKIIGGKSQRQLLLALGGEDANETTTQSGAATKTGGAVLFIQWMKKNHPDGTATKPSQLKGTGLLAEWEKYLAKLSADKNPDGESRRRALAREFYDELRNTLAEEKNTHRRFLNLPDKDLDISILQIKDLLAALTAEAAKT